jgi:PAS domain S-box-containing protein
MDSTQSRRYRRLITLVTLWVSFYASGSAQRTADSDVGMVKRVLALHIIRRDSPEFDDTFRAALREGLSGRLDYYSDYIDLNRLGEDEYQSALRTYLRTRYADGSLDLVIASGPSVVEFLNRDPTLFKGLPVVFTTRPGVSGGPNSTGIVSTIDFISTLSAALAAQPNTKQVFVVSGIAAFDTLYADLFKAQRAPFEKRVTFYDLAGLTLPELLERVRYLPPDSIIFYLSVSNDGAGHTVMPLDAIDPIAAAANAPVYSWHEDALGHGIVGGRLHSSVNDAKQTAQIALRVLKGEKPEAIPVVTADSYAFQFDWRQLQRWNISESRLPADSVIGYRQPSFFEQYRSYVMGGALVMAAQGLLIGGLLIQRRRRRRAEDALRHSEARNSAVLRALPDLMFVLDRNGKYLDCHARDGKALLVPPHRFLGKTVWDVMPPDLADTFMKAIEKTGKNDEPVVLEYALPMGELRHYEARLVPSDDGRIVSIVRDVTESKRANELNRALVGRIIVSQEEERQRIARELHDDLSQKVALLNLEVDQIANEVPLYTHRTRLEQVSSQVGEIASGLSDLSHQLHPSRLQTLGLTESVRLLCREISQQRHVKVEFSSARLPHSVDPGVSLCLYRIAQEALHNVAKHSQAQDASVYLARDGNFVDLQISDSGVGFDPNVTTAAGLGLVSMRERVGVLKGHLVIYASPGQGTRIGVRVPLNPGRQDGHVTFGSE